MLIKQHFFNVLYIIIIVKTSKNKERKFYLVFVFAYSGQASVFWVVGNASANSVLVTDFLATNQHKGDRLRRVFPLSLFDYSVEITINRDTYERSYSCVIDGIGEIQTTLFTYVVRSVGKWTCCFSCIFSFI